MGIYRAMKHISVPGKKKDKAKELEITNEIEMLKAIDHPNIVKVFEFYAADDWYYIITEFCSGWELFDMITEKGSFWEAEAAYLMY